MATNIARLRVELPHWAADIRLVDDLSRPVHDIPQLRAEPGGHYVTDIDAPAGIYDLEITFLGKTFRDEIALSASRPRTWTPPPDWSQLAAPAGLTATHRQIEEMVRDKKRTWEGAKGDSQLRLSIRMVDEDRNPAPIRPMRLCQYDASDTETLITDLIHTSERPADGQIAFAADLQSGHYVLKSQTAEGAYWCRPVYLAPQWATNIAISVDRSPTGQRLVSLCMSKTDRENPPNSAVDVAYLAVLDALTRGTDTQFITKEHIDTLTVGEDADPWLAVIASYALLPAIESEPFRPRRSTDRDTVGLFHELQKFLTSRLPDHPDVRALALSSKASSAAFAHPPLMLAGLRRVRMHAAQWRGTIPSGSLTDRLLDEVAPGAPWTTWIEGRQRSSAVPGADRKVERPPFLQNVGSKAPVFRIRGSGGTRSASPAESSDQPDAREILRDARIVDLVSRAVYVGGAERPLLELDADMSSDISKLLTLEADVIGRATNLPIDRVEKALASLRAAATPTDEPRDPSPLGPVEQQLVAFAIGENAFAPKTPGATPIITIEDVLSKLRSVAAEVASLSDDKSRDSGHVKTILAGVDRVVSTLLECAALIALTDANGGIVYGNGAFLAFLDLGAPGGGHQASRLKSRASQADWEDAFRNLGIGESILTNVGGPDDETRWKARRAPVKDRGASTIAFVNVLTMDGAPTIDEPTLARVSVLAHRAALGASVYAYGSGKSSQAHGDTTLDALREIDQLLTPSASDAADQPAADPSADESSPSPNSLDVDARMFRSSSKTDTATIMMGRTRVGPVNAGVTYAEIEGRAIFEGDIDLGPADELRMAERGIGIGRGVGINGSNFRWPSPVIPFESVDALQDRVTAATDHWSRRTPFKFVKRTNELDFLSFEMLNGCFSMVGRQGGKQIISVGAGCGLGHAVHEIGHALGLWHEQSRSDRDEHVTVLFDNVAPAQRHNFDKHLLDGTDLGAYDFASIMHYPRNAFSINGEDTIRTKDGQPIGQRNGLSSGDIAAIKLLYPQSSVFDWSRFDAARPPQINADSGMSKKNETLLEQVQFSIERHEVIAGAAERFISADTAKAIAKIVEPLGAGISLVDLAAWADRIKRRPPNDDDDQDTVDFLTDERNSGQDTWHFVDIPAEATEYNRTTLAEFTRDEDVVQMLTHAIKVLQGKSDRFSKLNALRLVVHLVGDVHQPVHVGCSYLDFSGTTPKVIIDPNKAKGLADDHGGNSIMLPIGKNGTSLHSYWDGRLAGTVDVDELTSDADFNAAADAIEASEDVAADASDVRTSAESREEVEKNIQRLVAAITSDNAAAAGAESDSTPSGPPEEWPVAWAKESLDAARSAYKALSVVKLAGPKSKKVLVKFTPSRDAYDTRNAPIILARMKSAARNLALLLDTVLA